MEDINSKSAPAAGGHTYVNANQPHHPASSIPTIPSSTNSHTQHQPSNSEPSMLTSAATRAATIGSSVYGSLAGVAAGVVSATSDILHRDTPDSTLADPSNSHPDQNYLPTASDMGGAQGILQAEENVPSTVRSDLAKTKMSPQEKGIEDARALERGTGDQTSSLTSSVKSSAAAISNTTQQAVDGASSMATPYYNKAVETGAPLASSVANAVNRAATTATGVAAGAYSYIAPNSSQSVPQAVHSQQAEFATDHHHSPYAKDERHITEPILDIYSQSVNPSRNVDDHVQSPPISKDEANLTQSPTSQGTEAHEVHPCGISGPVGISERIPEFQPGCSAPPVSTKTTGVLATADSIYEPTPSGISQEFLDKTRAHQQTLSPPSLNQSKLDNGTRDLANLSNDEAISAVGIPPEQRNPEQQAAVNSILSSANSNSSGYGLPSAPYSVSSSSSQPADALDLNAPPNDATSTRSIPPASPRSLHAGNPFQEPAELKPSVPPKDIALAHDHAGGVEPRQRRSSSERSDSHNQSTSPSKMHGRLNTIIGGMEAGVGKLFHSANMQEKGMTKREQGLAEMDDAARSSIGRHEE